MSEKNILVVDDEEMLLMFMKDFLEFHHYSVTTCADPLQAMMLLESSAENFSLLITDQNMPGLTGLGLIEKVREKYKELPIILCSGFNEVVGEDNIEKNKISFYLQKPVENVHLVKCINQLLS